MAIVALFGVRRKRCGSRAQLARATVIFVQQLHFWWAISKIPTLVQARMLGVFILAISLPLLLYVAPHLILPLSGQDDRLELKAASAAALLSETVLTS